MSLQWPVQDFKVIGQLRTKLWANTDFTRCEFKLSLSEGYSALQIPN